MKRHGCTASLALAILLASIRLSAGLDLKDVLADYLVTSWSVRNGLPSNGVWALAQDPVGYLWVGTDGGLIRFDGVRFVTWDAISDTPLPKASVKALTIGADGSLWVGFAEPGGVSRIQNGRSRDYTEPDGFTRSGVNALAVDRHGTVWAGTNSGLYRFTGAQWQKVDGFPSVPVRSEFIDSTGRLLLGTDSGVFGRTADADSFTRVGQSESVAWAIVEDSRHDMLVTDSLVGYRSLNASADVHDAENRGRGNRLLRDARGDLWIATRGQGLWRVRTDADKGRRVTERATTLTGLAGDWVWAILEDRDGNIWAGAAGGLSRLAPRLVTPMHVGLVDSLEATADGTIWAQSGEELLRFSRVSGELRGKTELPAGAHQIAPVRGDRSGPLWIATRHDLLRMTGGRVSNVPIPTMQPTLRIDAIAAAERQALWLYDSRHGLFKLTDGRWKHFDTNDRALDNRVLSMFVDRLDRLWLTLKDGAIAQVTTDGAFHEFGTADGVAVDAYLVVYEDRDANLWFGGTNGISRFANGHFRSLTVDSRFPITHVVSMVQDEEGFLWIGTASGIIRMEPGEFDRTIDQPSYQVRHTLYDISDGLNGIPTRGHAVRSTDGRLWFLTGRGITVLDPHALSANRSSTPLRIEEVIANDRHYRPGSTLVLPPGSARLEIDYSTLDLRTSLKTRYRYRLDDFDRGWIDVGTRRQAFYTNLPPRTYRFRVMASNSDGIWTDAATTVDFEIQPMFYQTMGFYALCLTALVSVVCLAWRLHVRRVRQQFALLLRERVRLSNELHDTLVQGLVGVGLQCDAIAATLNSSSHVARSQLGRARSLIDRYIREAHYAIHDLRSPALETSDVAEALRQAGERVLAGAPVRFDLDVVGTPVRGAPKVEEQIVRIGEEAILNAARHARPSNVSLKLVYSADALHLGVSDDGCGFELPRQDRLSGDGHCGIRSMQERTELVGGSFRIDSAIGRGTRLEVVIPRARYVG